MRKSVYFLLLLISTILFSILYFDKKLSAAKSILRLRSGLILSGACLLCPKGQSLAPSNVSKIILINNHKIKVEIAGTDILREKGLSSRVDLAQDAGMLFVFPSSGYHYFWMKDMKFPLDFVWIAGDTVVDLTDNVPIVKNGQNNVIPPFTSRTPAEKILEVNSGIIKSLNISVGDKISYEQ